MGWASGSEIMNKIIKVVKKNVPDESVRREIYQPIYEAFTDSDWDTVDESLGLDEVFDQIAAEDGWGEDWEND